jgi:hypothetical protein
MKKICFFLLLLICNEVLFAAQSLENLRVNDIPGCKKSSNKYRPELLDCTALAPKQKLNLREIREVPDALGGLTPAVPMIQSFVSENWRERSKNKGVRVVGCRLRQFLQYSIYTKGEIRILDTPEAFRSFFAPVNSAAEAFSFAVALTGSEPIHKIDLPVGMAVEASDIPPTFVRKVSEGYLVHLFDYDLCGCGPHWTYSVEYLVRKDGTVEMTSRKKFYRDPQQDGLCVD